MIFNYPEGATPIDENERHALIPLHIQTQEQLNAFEQANIALAMPWAIKQKDILNVTFLKRLHKKMFDKTWRWAGEFRKTQKNIGISSHQISQELYLVCTDSRFQIDNNSFSNDEIAIRFHHRLVFIHPFANGNGRHSRLAADLLMRSLGEEVFSWGSKTYDHHNLSTLNEMRSAYIKALREADQGNYGPLLIFARS